MGCTPYCILQRCFPCKINRFVELDKSEMSKRRPISHAIHKANKVTKTLIEFGQSGLDLYESSILWT